MFQFYFVAFILIFIFLTNTKKISFKQIFTLIKMYCGYNLI